MLIFVSPTAVEEGLAALNARGTMVDRWPPGLAVAAVGRGTALALRRHGLTDVIVPESGADSEALARLPVMQSASLRDSTVVLVRGEGGRDGLVDVLRSRGARVELAECYRRVRPTLDAKPLANRWRVGGVAAVTAYSRGALDNLFLMLPEDVREPARRTPLFVSHPRIAEHARVTGMQQVQVSGPDDDAMVEGIKAFFAKVAS